MIEEKKYELGNKNINICLLTDLHFSTDYNLSIFDKILDNIKKNKPNYICLSGDIIDNTKVIRHSSIEKLKDFIVNLSLLSPVIISLGNHDITYKFNNKKYPNDYDYVNQWFLNLNKIENVYYLNNKSLIRNDICFTGYNPSFYYYQKEYTSDFIKDIDSSISLNRRYYNILLCHSPINVLKEETLNNSKQVKKADLVLSGHMHNGMVFKIFDHGGNIGFVSPTRRLFPNYARNKITKTIDDHEINLVISGGITKLSRTTAKSLAKLNFLYPISIVYVKI